MRNISLKMFFKNSLRNIIESKPWVFISENTYLLLFFFINLASFIVIFFLPLSVLKQQC